MTDYTVAVLEDAVHLLELLKRDCDSLTLAQITQESGLVKNKVFRLLFTLEKHGLVDRDDAGRYRLGLRFLEFSQNVQSQTSLLQISAPIMDTLVEKTHESIFLGVISGADALCVAARESPRSVRLFAQVGRRAPLYKGGVPKVLFAYLPDESRASLLERFFGHKPLRQTMEKRLEQIRQQGYAVEADDLDSGAHSVAVPIFDYQGRVIAALSIAGPSHRFPDETIERYIHLALDASMRISQALGYRPVRQVSVNGAGEKHTDYRDGVTE